MTSATKTDEKAVLVTTQFRGVFYGYVPQDAKPLDGELTLTRARNCLWWPREVGGFLGLATVGPIGETRVGKIAERVTLFGVTSIAECTPAAVDRWETAR